MKQNKTEIFLVTVALTLLGLGILQSMTRYHASPQYEPPVVAEPVIKKVLGVAGHDCWLDANPEFEYTANQQNVLVKLTCPVDAMAAFIPAEEVE